MQTTANNGANNSFLNVKLSGFTPHFTDGFRINFFSSTNSGFTNHHSPSSRWLMACSNLSFSLVIIGPTTLPPFHTPPTCKLVTASVSFVLKSESLYTSFSSKSNEQAEHFCPALLNAEVTIF